MPVCSAATIHLLLDLCDDGGDDDQLIRSPISNVEFDRPQECLDRLGPAVLEVRIPFAV